MPSGPTRNDLRKKLNEAQSLAEAVLILRDFYGSDDNLAERLGTSRQRTIRWHKHGEMPDTEYREKLAAEGVPRKLLVALPVTEVRRRLGELEAELAELKRLLE